MPGRFARSNFYPCRHQAGHPILRAQSAGSTPFRRAPSKTTITRRVTRVLPGRADLQALSSIEVGRSARNGVAPRWLECRPERNLAILQIAPQGDRETARERDDADTSRALATACKALVKP